ncbi:polynucleotide 5'-hydroxyl-kinase NOL9 [Amyelois transitella]|uniref:polynucleotide 5'-hydroxyl-kinase NOL9 n=1 Tax=Amyelois transitella TaxID=680683 RepID=UPI0029905296|nr:polynucleotide 5'-hydroxyl-kinase NOL9 [Amyelois transitella]
MDFFEKAHISKNEPVKKDTKSEETVKKKLKLMLEGYKQNDNQLIMKSENLNLDPHRLLDDSSSVSGFSDLNLSNSSNEGDVSRGHESQEDKPLAELEHSKDDEEFKDSSASIGSSLEMDSISECNDTLDSLSEDTSSNTSSDYGMFGSTTDTATEVDLETSTAQFDADGALASKILQRLNKKVPTKKKAIKKIPPEFRIDDQMETDGHEDSDASSTVSSPFVSVSATEMSNQSLNDLLGNYRHSTVRNMPSDIQTINTSNETMFPVEVSENIVVTDIDIQSDNEVIAKDGDFDLSDYSPSIANESALRDDTLDSEMALDSSLEFSEELVESVKVYYARNCCIFVMKHPAKLYIHGKINIQALGGSLEIFGYKLKDEVYKVYAPNYNYAHCLRTVNSENSYYGLFGKLTSSGLSVYEAEEIVTSIGASDGVVCMTSLKCKQMDFVENNFELTDLFSKVNRQIDNCLRQASEILRCSLYLTGPWKCFEENASWSQAFDRSFYERSRGIVCGGKGVGKSTFLRYSVNRLLSQGPVLVVDLDPGQAEFTVAGSVSATVVTKPLLGPNFTHLQKPDKMLYLGMINTMDNPRRYAAAVAELVTHCREHEAYQRMPWIVNTMGMCNAMGLKFITHTIMHTQPTFLLQIDSKAAKKRFQCYLNPGTIKNIYNEEFKNDSLFKHVPVPEALEYSFFLCDSLEVVGKKDFSLAPRDERYLNYLAYFGDLLRAREEKALLGITPYEVNFRELQVGFNVRVAPEAALKVINGKVVALCHLPRGDVAVFTLRDKPLLCYGHGLVRGIDYEREKVYIITPCRQLASVNTLVYADWAPELRGQERHLPEGVAVPYRTTTTRHQRQLMSAPRRRFNPLQLLKMSRSS